MDQNVVAALHADPAAVVWAIGQRDNIEHDSVRGLGSRGLSGCPGHGGSVKVTTQQPLASLATLAFLVM